MPQASKDLQQKILERFGTLDDNNCVKFLEDAGYKLDRRWRWAPKPGVTSYAEMTQDEFDMLKFLSDEWDYGGMDWKNAEYVNVAD